MESLFLPKRKLILFILDAICNIFSLIISTAIVNSHMAIKEILPEMLPVYIAALFAYPLLFWIFRVYSIVIVYASLDDYIRIAFSSLLSSMFLLIVGVFSTSNIRNLLFTLIVTACISTVFTVGSRILAHLYFIYNRRAINFIKAPKKTRVLIIGAGAAAGLVINNLRQMSSENYEIVGLIDDDNSKLGKYINGIKVLGNRNNIIETCKTQKVDIILLSIAAISLKDKKEILDICSKTNCRVRVLPKVDELVMSGSFYDNFRGVEIEDLLAREPIKLDTDGIAQYLKDQVVMVTGGAGSIGSELCRQIAKYSPKNLIVLDFCENALYNIDYELKENYKGLNYEVVMASIRDHARLRRVFSKYKPDVVFHAAAHKHVPLMEANPVEAVKNNIFGTLNLVNTCMKYDVKRFVLISTDKAVRPTSIMGATKRICEKIVQAASIQTGGRYASVRFGNVLGSNGSVVPLFIKQIAQGGPVTVTHRDITRYFMTIPEAAGLVLQAGAYAKGGEIFVLDMGEPVKIYDLAVNLIKLSGLEPNVDIPIKITKLRPGEKLYEELLTKEEGLTKTLHDKICIAKPAPIDIKELAHFIEQLSKYVDEEDEGKIKEIIKKLVPSYKIVQEIQTEPQKLERITV